MLRITPGQPEHAESILAVRQAVRTDTYTGYSESLTAEYLAARNTVTAERITKETARLTSSQWRYWVAQDDDTIIGYVKAEGPPRQSICYIHVLKEYQGKRIGSELMSHALSWLDLSQPVYIEVVEGNDQAKEWYKRLGFRETGHVLNGTPIPTGGFLREIEMVLAPQE